MTLREYDEEYYPNLIKKYKDLYFSLYVYTNSGFLDINASLRNNSFSEHVPNIDKALELYSDGIKKYGLDRPKVLYRYIYIDDFKEYPEMVKSGIYFDKAYMSSSIALGAAHSRLLLEIWTNTLTIGANLTKISEYSNEQEFLLKRGLSFEIVDKSEKKLILEYR